MSSPIPFYAADGIHAACYDALQVSTFAPGTTLEGDAAWYAARAREWGGPVLEGAVGTGRVAWEIARAGIEVVGFDASPAMLGRAEAKRAAMPPEASARARFVKGDLREFDLGRTFPLAIVPFRAFQCLLEPEEQAMSLACFRRHLEPGGRLALNLFDPDYRYLTPGSRFPKEHTPVVHPDRGTRVVVTTGARDVDPLRQVFHEVWEFREEDAAGATILEEKEVLHMRWTFRYEMRHLLVRAGFEIEAEYSDFRGSPPAYGREQVWVARKPL
jgi:ubiquinone/menaquinone biosynthesis C-methylase UbiE